MTDCFREKKHHLQHKEKDITKWATTWAECPETEVKNKPRRSSNAKQLCDINSVDKRHGGSFPSIVLVKIQSSVTS